MHRMVISMGGGREDSTPARVALPPVPPAPRPSPLPPVADHPAGGRRGWLVVGLVLAAGATAAVFFTEDPLYLRVALLAVCWAFVVAAFLAGNRRADQLAAAAREAALRHAYDLELEREVTARHEHQGELESRLRRDAEDAVRDELGQLRTQLSGLQTLRDDLAAVGQLRSELAGLGRLRDEITALTDLRGELAGLGQLRAELAGLGELRDDLGRIRAELTEQLSGELLIERMVMRAQSVRGPAQSTPDPGDGRTLEGAVPQQPWESQPLPSGWDVDGWSGTRVVPAEPAPRPAAGPPPVPPVTRASALLVEPGAGPEPAPRHHRWAAEPDDARKTPWSPDPADLPPARPAADAPSSYDDLLFGPSPSRAPSRYDLPSYEVPSYEVPSYGSPSPDTPAYEGTAYEGPAYESYLDPSAEAVAHTGSTAYDPSGYAAAPVDPSGGPTPQSRPEPSGHARLEQILAESGVPAPTGGRSGRRRYRDEDGGTDDVLSRVLGRG